MIVLSTAYLGNIQYFTKLVQEKHPVEIERHENYVKQSFRHRGDICGANGIISLTVPVRKHSGKKTPISEVEIDNGKNWQHRHWNAIESAYRNSPYFDFYRENFEPFYRNKYRFLWEFNREIQQAVFDTLEISPTFSYTNEYRRGPGFIDCRNSLTPKPRLHRPDPAFEPAEYWQVFSDRYGFLPNLSILDLLFCEGPESLVILRRSTRPEFL